MTPSETHPTIKVARDLAEIRELVVRLAERAVHLGASGLMPGGMAQVALGPESSPETWSEQIAFAELHHLAECGKPDHRRCRFALHLHDEDDQDHEPPLQTLLFWSEAWRDEHGYPLGQRRPTLASEAAFLGQLLDWAWQHEPHWEDLARDINRARVRLEDVLHAGKRVEKSRIVCDRCSDHPRLIVLRGVSDDGSDDRWKCPGCKHRFDADQVRRAHSAMLRSAGAERWIHQADAIALLRDQGRPEPTVRQWLREGEGQAYCDPVTHEVWVWWPDLWRKHLVAPTRRRRSTA